MSNIGADRFVLQEFRLADGASHDDAARILASPDHAGVPLLTSISDERDVAFVRCVPSAVPSCDDAIDRTRLRGLVSRWQDHRTYRPSIAESSLRQPNGYSLAVTESGLNDEVRPDGAREAPSGLADADQIALLWIGAPVGNHAGLLVLVGRDGRTAVAGHEGWPLPLSDQLGVRIYRSERLLASDRWSGGGPGEQRRDRSHPRGCSS